MLDFDQAEQALQGLRNLHIGSGRDREAMSHINRLLARDGQGNLTSVAKRFTKTGETRGVMVVGEPGSGKSHLINRTCAKLEPLQAREDGSPRFIQCSVPSPATFKSVILQLLNESGYPDANPRKENWSLVQDLRYRLSLLGISVIWIDEAHDLFCADSRLILRALKSLMQGDDAVAIILSGTKELASVIRSDAQVQRRFTSLVLPNLVEQVDGDNFKLIVKRYCAQLGLAVPEQGDLIGRIFHASRYCFGRAIELLLMAMEFAIDSEDTVLELRHFASVYAMNEGCDMANNVFLVDKYWFIQTDFSLDEPTQGSRKWKR